MSDLFGKEEKEAFFDKMQHLSSIYKRAKRLILLSEYYNSKQGIVVSTINELRNSLDHIMRSLLSRENSSDELFKAEGHLYRSIYDACEVIIIDRLDYIESFKNDVTFSSLEKVYPNYRTKVLPYITQIKEELVAIRQIPITEERIKKYEDAVANLIEICDDLDKIAPSIKRKTTFMLPALLGVWTICFLILNAFLDSSVFVIMTMSLCIVSIPYILIYSYKKNKK